MKTVLIVEDDQTTRNMLASILRKAGHLTLLAESSRKAMVYLRRAGIDLVILDLMMPEIDGLSLLENLRSRPQTKNIPVIICSGTKDKSMIKKAVSLGISEFIPKPFTVESVNQKLAKASIPVAQPDTEPAELPKEENYDHEKTNIFDENENIDIFDEQKLTYNEPDFLEIDDTPSPENITVIEEENTPETKNALLDIVQNMNSEIVRAGKKLEFGELCALEIFIRELLLECRTAGDENLLQQGEELKELIDETNDTRKRYLLALRSKIHTLTRYLEEMHSVSTDSLS